MPSCMCWAAKEVEGASCRWSGGTGREKVGAGARSHHLSPPDSPGEGGGQMTPPGERESDCRGEAGRWRGSQGRGQLRHKDLRGEPAPAEKS
jgi:hypothetical protein